MIKLLNIKIVPIVCHATLLISVLLVALGCGESEDLDNHYSFTEEQRQEAQNHFAAAVALESNGQLEEAIAKYAEVVHLTPRDVVALSNLGTIYDKLGQYQQAIESYNQAIGVNPNFNVLYNNRSISYYNRGEYELALEDLDRFIKTEPDNADSYVGRAMVYAQLGRDEEAQSDVIKAVKLGVDATQVELLIADIKNRR